MDIDGGPAFPYSALTPEGPQIYGDSLGMSLRDYFAAQALPSCFEQVDGADAIAALAYMVADAMLMARKPSKQLEKALTGKPGEKITLEMP